MDLVACPACRRHVRAASFIEEGACPFCSSTLSRRFVDGTFARVSVAIGAAGFAASLNACYGAPRGGYGAERPREPSGTYVRTVDDADAALLDVEARAKAAGCMVSRTENVVRAECSFESFSFNTGTNRLIVNCGSSKGDACQAAYERLVPKN